MDVWFWIRVADYFLYGGLLTGIVAHSRHLHIPGWPGFRWWLWGFIAGSAYATVEVMFRDVPGGPRLIFVSVPLAGLFVGCYLPPLRALIARRSFRKEKP
jgi:hypothetical protein